MTSTLNTLEQNVRSYGSLFACLTCFWAFHFVTLWSSAFAPHDPTANLDLSSDLIWIISVSCNALALAVFLGFISKLQALDYARFSLASCMLTAFSIVLIATRVFQSGLAWDAAYLAGIALFGFGSGFFMACLAKLLCSVQPQTTFMGMTASFACGSLICLVITIALVPFAIGTATALLPLATAFFYTRASRGTEEGRKEFPARRGAEESFTPGTFFLLVAVIGVTAGIMRDTSHASSTAMIGDHLFVIAVFATGLVLFALSSSVAKLRPTLLLQIVVIVIAGAFIALALMAREAPAVAFAIHTSAFVCFVALVWFFCTYFAQKNGSGVRGFAAGLFANQAGQALGSLGYFGATVLFGSTDSLLLYMSMGVVYVLFVVALVFFAHMNRIKRDALSAAGTTNMGAALDALRVERELTPRETEIAALIVEGSSRSAIAQQLTVSQETVKTHTKHLYQKLDVHSRDELVELLNRETERMLSV